MSGGLVFGSGIAAYADSTCSATPTSAGAGGVTACVPTPIGSGTVSVTTSGGYIVADGLPSNGNPLGGYVGVEGNPSGVNVVACSNGDYSATGHDETDTTADAAGASEDANGNGVLVGVPTSPSGSPTLPSGPPTGECAPANPPTAPTAP
ncbi:MAG: hypothetical protein ACYCS2_04155 [Acidimicrobiales bacterium]